MPECMQRLGDGSRRKKCCQKGNDEPDLHFVCPRAVAYTGCFAVPSNS
jgi:hypothetical protein